MTLPKSRELVSFPLFQKLIGLFRNKPWLETRAAAVEELHEICSNERDLELVVDLLEQFTFLSGNDFESRCAKIAQKITQDWKLSASDTVLVGKHFESGRGDSSGVINAMMQPALARTGENWSRRNFEISAKKALQNFEFKNIVLVDDFSGSGESAAKFLKWAEDLIAQEKLGKKNIYLAFFCAMEKTKERIPIDNRIFVVQWLKRGISDYYTAQEVPSRLTDMVRLESFLDQLPHQFSLGFEKSESLYSAQNMNIPNNNFPIFWWDRRAGGTVRNPMFYRVR